MRMQTRKPHLVCNSAVAGESYCTMLLKSLPQNRGKQAKTSSKEYDSFDTAPAVSAQHSTVFAEQNTTGVRSNLLTPRAVSQFLEEIEG